ncbi:uncharacterized protein LOC134255807 [Saccostrea cucullata]|uniref:uncharacterized protein LOC134255807 n=1 Tax=Saccostrea cuccullata TaxID=36930 RepID=UPI002ED49AB6
MLHTLEFIILNFLLNFKADCTTHSSPCLETQYWKKYEVRCSENETIYIRQHNIGESCQEEVLGYDEKKVNSCSYSLPLSKTITDYQTPFTKTVNKCNGKRECVLFTDYFEKIESENGALCRNPNTSIFQRIEYECIPDVYVVDNCVREVDVDNQSELHDIYLRFSVMNRNHSCLLIGELSGIEILHTYSSVLRLLYQNHPVYEHLESSIGLYGVQISIQTIGLVLEMQGFDYSSIT